MTPIPGPGGPGQSSSRGEEHLQHGPSVQREQGDLASQIAGRAAELEQSLRTDAEVGGREISLSPSGRGIEVDRAYRESVRTCRVRLAAMERALQDRGFLHLDSQGGLTDQQISIIRDPSSAVLQYLGKALNDFNDGATDLVGEIVAGRSSKLDRGGHRRIAAETQAVLSPLTDQGRFCREVRESGFPGGAPGNHNIIRQILDVSPGGTSFLGYALDTLCVTQMPLSIAHQQRVLDIATLVDADFCARNDRHYQIESMGCGPGRDLVLWFADNRFRGTWTHPLQAQRVHIVLYDSDDTALAGASRDILAAFQTLPEELRAFRGSRELITTTQANMLYDAALGNPKSGTKPKYWDRKDKIFILPPASELPRYPLQFHEAAGVYDYFSDSLMKPCLAMQADATAQGGLVVATVVAPHKHEAGLGVMFNWHLVTRSRDDLVKIGEWLGEWSRTAQDPTGSRSNRPFDAKYRGDLTDVEALAASIRTGATDRLKPGEFCVLDCYQGNNLIFVARLNE